MVDSDNFKFTFSKTNNWKQCIYVVLWFWFAEPLRLIYETLRFHGSHFENHYSKNGSNRNHVIFFFLLSEIFMVRTFNRVQNNTNRQILFHYEISTVVQDILGIIKYNFEMIKMVKYHVHSDIKIWNRPEHNDKVVYILW